MIECWLTKPSLIVGPLAPGHDAQPDRTYQATRRGSSPTVREGPTTETRKKQCKRVRMIKLHCPRLRVYARYQESASIIRILEPTQIDPPRRAPG
jgi:hypothetical protein